MRGSGCSRRGSRFEEVNRRIVGIGLLLAALAPSAAEAYPIEVRGNVALPSAVYESAIFLSDQARTKTATIAKKRARQVARSALDFLLASGYDLATATATIADGVVYLDVEEGRLDKIIFMRQGTLRTLELKFSIKLPGDIFNRPLLQQQLDALVRDTDVTKATFEVVKVERVRHAGVQIEEPRLLRGLELLKPGAPHELHIYLERPDRRDGLRLQLGIRSPDGFYGGLKYNESDLVLKGDKLDTEARVGFRLDDEIDTASNPVGLSRLQAAIELHSPPFGDFVSTYMRFDASLFARLRRDLNVANYYYVPLEGSVNASMLATDTMTVSLGVGVQERFLFGIDPVEGETVTPLVEATEREDLRIFMAGSIELDFEKNALRLDRGHRLELSGRYLTAGNLQRSNVITKLFLEYDKAWVLGYDEFHLGVNGVHIFGRPFFYDELSIGDGFLRAAFGNDIFLKRALGASFEYRVSLSRDAVKVSIFDDVAAYQDLDDDREPTDLRAATTFGLGLHVLLLDAFQLSTYAGLGIAAGRELGFGVALSVQRAY